MGTVVDSYDEIAENIIMNNSEVAITGKKLIIAHRGESEDAPENTLASVNLAWERKADAVEVDIRLTADGRIVVIHDANTGRVSGKYRSVRKSKAGDLRKLDVGTFKGDKWSGEKIPFLLEVLKTVPSGRRIFIELKCGQEILTGLQKDLNESGLSGDQIVIIGFNFKLMTAVKKMMPKYEVCWLADIESRGSFFSAGKTDKYIKKIIASGLDGLDLKASRSVNKINGKKIKRAGLRLYVWTVDNPAEAKRLFEAGVDGVTTNLQQQLKRKLNELI